MAGNLRSAFRHLDQLRSEFPNLQAIGDRDVAKAYKRNFGATELDPIADSSGLMNLVARTFNTLENAGNASEQGIVGALGNNFGGRVLGRAANQAIQQGPELAGTAAVALLNPTSRLLSGITASGVLGSAGLRAYTDTGSPYKALGSVLANAGSMVGSIKGAGIGRTYLSRNIGRAGAPVGAFIGGIPGDIVDEAVTDGMEGLRQFFDPVNLAAYGIVNAVSDTALSAAHGQGLKNAINKQQMLDVAEATGTDLGLGTSYGRVFKYFDIPDNPWLGPAQKQRFADFITGKEQMSPTEAQLRMMEMTPPEQRMAQFDKEIVELKHKLAEEARVKETKISEIARHLEKGIETFPERPETLEHQLNWLNSGKRKVVMVPNGSVLPELYTKSLSEKFPKLETDRGVYVYDPAKIEPQEIMDAEAGNTLGDVLDYGVPFKPEGAENALVLRDKNGVEKLAVMFDNSTFPEVYRRMSEVYEPESGDTLFPESPNNVIEGRRVARPRVKDSPLSGATASRARKAYNAKVSEWAANNQELVNTPTESFARTVYDLLQTKPGDVEMAIAARLLGRMQGVMSGKGDVTTFKAALGSNRVGPITHSNRAEDRAAGYFDAQSFINEQGQRVSTSKKITVGVDTQGKFIDAISDTYHELSHAGLWDYMHKRPEEYAKFEGHIVGMGFGNRAQILRDAADLLGLGLNDADFDYMGQRDNQAQNAHDRWVITAEFTGAMSEMLATAELFRARTIDNFTKHLSFMPPIFTRALQFAVGKAYDFFNKAAGAISFIPKQRREQVMKAMASLDGRINRVMNRQRNAYNVLKNIERYDPEQILATSTNEFLGGVDGLDSSIGHVRNSVMRKEARKMHKLMKHRLGKFEEMTLSGLSTARLYPAFKPVFDILHSFRNNIKEMDMSYLAWLGQYNKPDANRVDAVNSFMDWIDKRAGAFPKPGGPRTVGQINQYIADVNNIRERKDFDPGKDILTPEKIAEKYKIDLDDARMAARLLELPQLVAQQNLNFQIGRDQFSIAKLLFVGNKDQNMNEVLQKAQAMTRAGHQIGQLMYERSVYNKELENAQQTIGPLREATIFAAEEKIKLANAQIRELNVAAEANLRIMFEGQFVMHPELGKDPFLNMVVSTIGKFGAGRIQTALIMSKPGYAPEIRRGRFLVTTYEKNEAGENVVKSTQGFQTKWDANKARKKAIAEVGEDNVQFTDKAELIDRVDMYTPKALKDMQDQMRREFNELAEKAKVSVVDHPNKADIIEAIVELQSNFRPMDQEWKEVMAVKGDGSMMERDRIPGFVKDDYIPNIIEYMSNKTITGQRGYTRAMADYFAQHRDIQSDPRLLRRTTKTIDYVLNRTREAPELRSGIFYMYLGASIRHMTQNFAQPFLAGSQLISDGGGMKSYLHFANGYKKLGQMSITGTTGDRVLDALLLEADRENVTVPSSIEFYLPKSAGLSDKVLLANQFLGHHGMRAKTKQSAREGMQVLTRVLRSTAIVSETINRRASFAAAYEMHKSRGVTDAKELFRLAKDFTNNVNFIGDKSNRAGFQIYSHFQDKPDGLLHPTVMTLTSLQSFTINQISQMYTFFKEGRLGSRNVVTGERINNPGLFKPWKNPSSHALLTTFAHLGLVSGVLGMVGAQVLDELFEKHFGISLSGLMRKGIYKVTDAMDWDRESGEYVSDLVMKGLPTAMGIDASNSLGLGSPVQIDSERETMLLDLIGPLGGIIKNVYNGADQIANEPTNFDNWRMGARQNAPQTLKHVIKTWDALFAGEYLDRQERPVTDEPLSTVATVSTLLGYSPRQVTKQREAVIKGYKVEKEMADRRDYASNAIARDLYWYEQDGDVQRLERARARFNNFLMEDATQDPGSLIDSIQFSKDKLSNPTIKSGTLRDAAIEAKVRAEHPSAEFPYQSAVDATLGGLQVSQSLGQEREVLQRLRSLKQGLPKKFLIDRLTQAGVHPAYGSLLSGNDRESRNRLLELVVRQDPYLADLIGTQ